MQETNERDKSFTIECWIQERVTFRITIRSLEVDWVEGKLITSVVAFRYWKTLSDFLSLGASGIRSRGLEVLDEAGIGEIEKNTVYFQRKWYWHMPHIFYRLNPNIVTLFPLRISQKVKQLLEDIVYHDLYQ